MPESPPTNSIDTLQAQVEAALQALDLAERQPRALYEPLSYILQMPAKRTRPVLCLLAAQAYGAPAHQAMPVALALELFHNFTLLHDDIMDNAPTRRGQATVHTLWCSNTAILSGDALYAYTQQLLASLAGVDTRALLGHYSRMALEVCEGQMRDMELATQPSAGIHDYLQMIEQKTAALLGAALAMGALVGGANADTQDRLDGYGRRMGIGFQLLDDLLDVYAEADKFGKQPGGDIIENKKTWLWLRALELAPPTLRAQLEQWAAVADRNAEKVAFVTDSYNQLGIPAATRSLIAHYVADAEALLQPLLPNPALQAMHHYLCSVLTRAY
ncbi:MAG: polyprenyl synthetase family protein [Sphingobacteriia bacterium]|jgi:geranylgeranyl diphosphate synthase type II